MYTVNREEFLLRLQSVQPGLSQREILEQSTCIIFLPGKIMTYNDEISCSLASKLKIEGAIRAMPLITILQKLKEEEVDLEEADGELIIHGKRKRAGIAIEKEIHLKVDAVEEPGKWRSLPQDFLEAIDIIQQCAGTDESQFSLTCIHVHPEWVEACDNFQAARFPLTTKFEESILVRRGALKHIVGLGMTEFSITDSWVHFRNDSGLVVSCRKYAEEYPKIDEIFKGEGEKMTLPKGLVEAADKALVFAADNDNKHVKISIRPGKLRLHGEGSYGWYNELCKIRYKGQPISFLISPKILQEIATKYSDCEVTENRLKVVGDKFIFVTCLGKEEEEKPGKEESDDE